MGTTCITEINKCVHSHPQSCENCSHQINSSQENNTHFSCHTNDKKSHHATISTKSAPVSRQKISSTKGLQGEKLKQQVSPDSEAPDPEVIGDGTPSFGKPAKAPTKQYSKVVAESPEVNRSSNSDEKSKSYISAQKSKKTLENPGGSQQVHFEQQKGNTRNKFIGNGVDEEERQPVSIEVKTKDADSRIIIFGDPAIKDEELVVVKEILMMDEEGNKKQSEKKIVLQAQQKNQQKEFIEVNWGNFIKIKRKNFTADYEIIQEIGKGGFGTVSKVCMKSNGCYRAMKSIKKSSLIHQDEQRFFAEMAILKQMDHPNIIKLHEIYDWKNYYYLITELCEGGELFEKLREYKCFTEKIAAGLMKSILSPVVYMHKQGIVHRDLKPQNLLYSDNGPDATLKIIDFGTSRKIEPGRKLTKQIGTAYYIAPEVLKRSYDEKCDVWSCGVILYILLCGYPPFRGATEKDVINSVKYGVLKFEHHSWKNISPQAIDLIKKMLNRNPQERITALEAMNSTWINHTFKEEPLENTTLENLRNFSFKNRLKAVVMTYIASQLYSSQDKQELLRAFTELDRDGDGVIEKQQLIQAFQHHYREHRNIDVNSIIKLIDTNNSGKIDFTEFLVAASGQEKLLKMSRLEAAFNYFDIDKSGFISIEEIRVFLGDASESTESIKKIFAQADENSDGKISKEQFIHLLLNGSE